MCGDRSIYPETNIVTDYQRFLPTTFLKLQSDWLKEKVTCTFKPIRNEIVLQGTLLFIYMLINEG